MDFIKFLGTAGARFAVTRQIRNSGGIWLSLDNTQLLIDPGPGALVRCLCSKPQLNPQDLDGIFLSHRHIDHSNDINIIIEAMTNGGNKKKGIVFAPSDALDNDPVVLHHFRNHVNQIVTLNQGGAYDIGAIHFTTPVRHVHDVETYGMRIQGSSTTISIITDTQYFEGIESYYDADILIVNVVLMKAKDYINHLSIEDVEKIIKIVQPKKTILTHFGLTMIQQKPGELAATLSEKSGLEVVAATDDMVYSIDKNEKNA